MIVRPIPDAPSDGPYVSLYTNPRGWTTALICDYCDYDAHVCQGCGAPLDHVGNTTDGHGRVWPHAMDHCYE